MIMEDKTGAEEQDIINDDINSYNDYLDQFVTCKDKVFLDSDEIPRQIVLLKYRNPELKSKNEIDSILAHREELKTKKSENVYTDTRFLQSHDIPCPLMRCLHRREPSVRAGKLQCIVFIRDFNKKGQEISGYIDFKSRLDQEPNNWVAYYLCRKKLLPIPSDLGYYNWTTFFMKYNGSQNWTINFDIRNGLRFKNKFDELLVIANPYAAPGFETSRIEIHSEKYAQCSIIDHYMPLAGDQ